MANKLNKSACYYQSISCTTNENGVVNLGVSSNKTLLVAWSEINIVLPFTSGGTWYAKVCNWYGMTVDYLPNTAVVINSLSISV